MLITTITRYPIRVSNTPNKIKDRFLSQFFWVTTCIKLTILIFSNK
jgi:hypothetical protein